MPAETKPTLEKILQLLGFSATVEEHHMEEGILLDVKADDSGRLIGRQGQTLADLQLMFTSRLSPPKRKSAPAPAAMLMGSTAGGLSGFDAGSLSISSRNTTAEVPAKYVSVAEPSPLALNT